eukprot:150665-Rhodomonas_salina.2
MAVRTMLFVRFGGSRVSGLGSRVWGLEFEDSGFGVQRSAPCVPHAVIDSSNSSKYLRARAERKGQGARLAKRMM